mgnify:CR=1 FL=1
MAEAALITRGFRPRPIGACFGKFGKYFVQTGAFDQELGRALRRAYYIRLAGDYAVGLTVTRREAEDLRPRKPMTEAPFPVAQGLKGWARRTTADTPQEIYKMCA